MRIVCFNEADGVHHGFRQGDEVAEFDRKFTDARSLVEAVSRGTVRAAGKLHKYADLKLLPPIPAPPKIICIGLNYRDHAEEGGHSIPTYPLVFLRVASSLTGPFEPILLPKESDQLDYEAELAFVIGTGGRHISEDAALDHVAFYSCFNDASLRDYQRRTSQMTMGKNFDRTGAFGPELVTPDELPSGAAGLSVKTWVNGELRQNGNTSDMIFSVAKTIEILSEVMSLEPGDVVITGTPAGVGTSRKPPQYLRAGDVCEVEIEKVGRIRNVVETH